MRKALFLLCITLLAIGTFAQTPSRGSLTAVNAKDGQTLGDCPLKSTSVKAEITGFLARVRVRQEFENNFANAIEAVYTFPLSEDGAVDEMTMLIGERVVRGKIMGRDAARETYETAKAQGKTASLLDQERPNIFTQSVANIMPGQRVVIEISYVETLRYENGAYEFAFPMTVGPRYIPASVKDAEKISPPVAATRNGSDITIEVDLDAGVPVEEIRSTSHEIQQINLDPASAKIMLKNGTAIPNKDFILRYDVTGKRIEDAVLAHRSAKGGFFTMILQPPDRIATEDRTPKEIVFVLDTSGSMYGFPIEKAKEAMRLSLDGLYPDDTFNLITFAGDTHLLFDQPVPATQSNLEKARAFLDTRQGGGGTEMMKAITAALAPSDQSDHLRIVCFMTDGYVGNENEIIAEVQRHPKARVFSFGIGSSVNRFLLDRMAVEGKGEVEYVSLTDDGSKAARKFYERVRTPLLTDLSIDWNGIPVADVYPSRLTDLFSAKPVILHGRYTGPATGKIRLKGMVAGQPYVRDIAIDLPADNNSHDALATLWARTRIDDLSSKRLGADGAAATALDKQVADLGIEFGLLTQFTSFVAVEEKVVNHNRTLTTVEVPVELPDGVNRETTLGPVSETVDVSAFGANAVVSVSGKAASAGSGRRRPRKAAAVGSGVGYGSGSASGNGSAPLRTRDGRGSARTAKDETKVSSTISRAAVASVPAGTTFSSLLTIAPGVLAGQNGGFAIDGASGSGNAFVIDGSEVMKNQTGQANANNPISLSGRAIAIAEPVYPAEAAADKALGTVEVAVRIDRRGSVVSAEALSGHEALRNAAVSAALLSKFAPAYFDRRPVRLSGIIAYKFIDAETVEIFIKNVRAEPFTDDDRRSFRLADKLHFWVYDLLVRLQDYGSTPGPNEAKFVRDGVAAVRIELSGSDSAIIEKLRAAGLAVQAKQGRSVIGTIAIEKLAALAALEEVRLILPNV